MSEKRNQVLDPFVNWAHNFGRGFAVIIVIYMFALPVIVCTVYDCFPSVSAVIQGAMPIATLFWPLALSECFSYPPILGSSTYLAFITGNVMNLKLPCAINAQKLTGMEPNTPEGDAVALLANSVSTIVTTFIVAAGMILMVPLSPIFTNATVQLATSYMLPAMFGCLTLGFLTQDKKGTWIKNKLLIPIVPAIVSLILYLTWPMASLYQGLIVILCIVLSIIIARILYKKGIVKVVQGVDAVPVEQ